MALAQRTLPPTVLVMARINTRNRSRPTDEASRTDDGAVTGTGGPCTDSRQDCRSLKRGNSSERLLRRCAAVTAKLRSAAIVERSPLVPTARSNAVSHLIDECRPWSGPKTWRETAPGQAYWLRTACG